MTSDTMIALSTNEKSFGGRNSTNYIILYLPLGKVDQEEQLLAI